MYYSTECKILSEKGVLSSLKEFVAMINDLEPLASIYLIGSYASRTNDKESDIDLLVVINTTLKDQLIDELKQIPLEKFPEIKRNLDCKVLSKRDLSQQGAINYLMLTSMFQTAQHLDGPKLKHDLSSHRLREALIQLKEQLNSVKHDISEKRNYDVTAVSLFSIAKSYFFHQKLFEPKNQQELKTILGRDFYTLSRIYNDFSKRGIQGNLSLILIKKGQKSGNYKLLSRVYNRLKIFEQEVTENFYQWFKES